MKKFVKALLAVVVVGMTAGFTTSASAEGTPVKETPTKEEAQKDPGTTPDSPFYFLDKFGEKIHLLFTSNPEKKSNLYLEYAKERLAESTKMAENSKDKYITELIDAYVANLEQAQEQIAGVAIDEKVAKKVKEQLATDLENTTTIVTDSTVEAVLTDEELATLKEKKQEAYLVANMVRDMNVEKVKALRKAGLGFGEIVKVIAFAEESGKTESEIVTMLQQDKKGFHEIAEDLNINPADILKKINNKKKDYIEQAYKEAIKAGNQSAIERFGRSIEAIEKEKLALDIAEDYAELEEEIKEKLAKIQQKVASGKITQEKADYLIQKLKKKSEKEMAELREDAIEEAKEIEEDAAEDIEEEKKDAVKKQEENASKAQEKAKEEKEKQVEKAKDTAEKEKERQEKVAENEKKAQEKAREKAEKEKEKAEEQARKDAEKAQKENNNNAENDNDDEEED